MPCRNGHGERRSAGPAPATPAAASGNIPRPLAAEALHQGLTALMRPLHPRSAVAPSRPSHWLAGHCARAEPAGPANGLSPTRSLPYSWALSQYPFLDDEVRVYLLRTCYLGRGRGVGDPASHHHHSYAGFGGRTHTLSLLLFLPLLNSLRHCPVIWPLCPCLSLTFALALLSSSYSLYTPSLPVHLVRSCLSLHLNFAALIRLEPPCSPAHEP